LRRVRGQALRAIGDTAGSLSTFREGAQIAHELGMPAMAMELEITAAVVAADAGAVEAGVVALRELVERAAAAGSVITESWACAALGWVLLRVDPAAALPIVEQGLVEARRIDYPIAVAVDLRSLAYARLLLGDLPGAIVAARELVEDLLERGALSNIRLAVDVAAVLAHGSGHPAWATLAATARALPISTLAAAHYELVPLPDVDAPVLGRREVISTVRAVLEDLAATVGVGDTPSPSAASPAAGDVPGPAVPSAWIERRGDVCEIGFASRVVTLRRSKGLDDLIRLIEADGREIHCLDVAGAAVEESSTGPMLDDAARRDYEQRIRDLQHDIDEAEQHHDLARAYASQVEMDTLVDHLTAALGLGAKTRSVGGTTERARSAVTHRIRSAVRRVEKLNPNLGRHLRHAINTGTYCSYRPEQPTTWRIT
jgi:hypothetical protein